MTLPTLQEIHMAQGTQEAKEQGWETCSEKAKQRFNEWALKASLYFKAHPLPLTKPNRRFTDDFIKTTYLHAILLDHEQVYLVWKMCDHLKSLIQKKYKYFVFRDDMVMMVEDLQHSIVMEVFGHPQAYYKGERLNAPQALNTMLRDLCAFVTSKLYE